MRERVRSVLPYPGVTICTGRAWICRPTHVVLTRQHQPKAFLSSASIASPSMAVRRRSIRFLPRHDHDLAGGASCRQCGFLIRDDGIVALERDDRGRWRCQPARLRLEHLQVPSRCDPLPRYRSALYARHSGVAIGNAGRDGVRKETGSHLKETGSKKRGHILDRASAARVDRGITGNTMCEGRWWS